MKKGNGKKTLRAVLAAALGTVMLMSLAWAGVTDVTGGKTTNTYTHTYHTNVIGSAAIKFVDDNGEQVGDVTTVTHESGFIKGNISDAAVQAEIAKFYAAVDKVIGDRRASVERDEKKLVFDHFESSNIIDTSGESILVGDIDGLEKAIQGSGINKNLDVHEYQKYTITQAYTVYATQIAAIRLENATLTFKAGDAPRFTGTVPEGACYTLARQSWFEDKEGGKGVTTDPNYTEYVGKELTAFAAGQRYSYLAKVELKEGYTLADNCRYFLNGQEVLVRTESGSQDEPFVRRFDDGEYFFAHMTPQKAQPEQPEQPEKPDNRGSGYSGPYVTTLLTAPDAKSATDFSGGIYGLTFRANTPFSGFLGVQVDGKTIDQSCYIAEENGGTEIYLKAVYLQTLAAGKHTMTVLSSAGDATTEFTIGGLNTAPKTFDAGVAVYGVTAVLSLGGMAWMGKKKEF